MFASGVNSAKLINNASPEKDATNDLEHMISSDKKYKSGTNSRSNSLNGSINGNKSSSTQQLILEENIEFDPEFDGLYYRDTVNSINTLKMLNVLRKNRQLCDLILQLDDDSQDIYCHQIILACNSKFFMEIFNNYEQEEKISCQIDDEKELIAATEATKNEKSDSHNETKRLKNSSFKKHSLQTIVNKNHSSNQKQLLFCLSDYLRNFLNDNYHHHYAKINSVINHNSQFHHHHYHHISQTNNHLIDGNILVNHDDESDHINHNLDYEALKICIDYMYTSKLKVPSHLLPHVYTLAYHLSIDNIVQICAQYLTKHLNADNCLSIRSFALDENLIQASTQCIEKNIEYILQMGPMNVQKSVSSSMSSLMSNSSNKLNTQPNELNNGASESLFGTSFTLTSSLNLANKEFNHLPRINIELVGLKSHKYKLPDSIVCLTELCMNWLVNELIYKQSEIHSLSGLCDNLNMLYMNKIDNTLHDCCDMESTDCNFNDYIDDYQKHHNILNENNANNSSNQTNANHTRQMNAQNKNGNSPSPSFNSRLKTFKITDQELNAIGTATPIKLKVLHDNEVICTHQTSENSFITICTLTGKLVTLSVHILPVVKRVNGNDRFDSNTENFSNEKIFDCDDDSKNLTNSMSNQECGPESQFSLDQQNNTGQSNQNNGIKIPKILKHSMSTTSSNAETIMDKLPKMSVARCSHGVIEYNKKLFIIGGYDRGECLDVCEVYDPISNTIEKIESMQSRRGRAAIAWFEKEKSIYVMGGSDGHEDLNSIERFNLINKKWSSIKFDFELSCSNLGAIACDNFIYLVGLKGESGKSLSRSSCLKYDPIANSFTPIADLNNGRSQSALVCISSISLSDSHLLYVFGGHDQIRCLNSCEVYNSQEDKWTVISSMHEPRRGCGAAVHKETECIYIVGGTNGSQSLKSVELYNTAEKKWTTGPDLNIARTNVAIAFIGDILFAVGGFDGKSFLRTIEYLDTKNLNNGWSIFHKKVDFEFLSLNSN